MASRELGFTLGPVHYAFRMSSLPRLHEELEGARRGPGSLPACPTGGVGLNLQQGNLKYTGGRAENGWGGVMKTGKD